jgi:hypothetical protein
MASDKDSRIGKVGSTSRTKEVEETESIKGVDTVKDVARVDQVKAVQGASNIDQVGRVMTQAERAHIMKIVDEEAEMFFQNSQIPANKRKMIKDAVSMAVDAGLLLKEDEDEE